MRTYLLALLAAALLYLAGYAIGRRTASGTTRTGTARAHTTIVERITKPGGVRVERVTTRDSEQQHQSVVAPPMQAQYGVELRTRLGRDMQLKPEVELSRRILGPIWLGLGYTPDRREVAVGLRVEY